MSDYPAGVKIIVLRANDEMLVMRRGKDHPTKPLRTDVPGGLIEKGEPEVHAATRELHEEAGIVVDHNDLELFFADSFVHPISQKSYTVLCYWVRLNDPQVTLSYEHDSYEWLSIEAFLEREDLEPIHRKSIEYAMSHDIFTT